MKSTKRVRFSIEIRKEMVEQLLDMALWLEEHATGDFRDPDLVDRWPRLANAIVDGLHEGRRRVVFSLPEDEEILFCFENRLMHRGFDRTYYKEWSALLRHAQAALASVRRPWLIQLADAING
jgi:hypothetical protein